VSGRTRSAGGPRAGLDTGLDRRRLIEDNVGLARHLAGRFSRSHAPSQDLVQAAMVGLVEAANRFDPLYGVPFSAFATRTIIGELKRHRRDTAWNVHVSSRTKELALRLPAAVRALEAQLHRSPTPDEVAARLGVSVEACLEAMDASSTDRAVADTRPGPLLHAAHEPHFSTVEERDAVARWMGRLSDVERQAVFCYFWGELSQAAIAERLGVGQMAISRILSRALDRMRGWAQESSA
jgi:RNA polymerase sigma-B factor